MSGLVWFINPIKSFSDHAHFGRLEVSLVGGLHDDKMCQSWPGNFLANYANKKKKKKKRLLKMRCEAGLHDQVENANHFQITYGIAVNIKAVETDQLPFLK